MGKRFTTRQPFAEELYACSNNLKHNSPVVLPASLFKEHQVNTCNLAQRDDFKVTAGSKLPARSEFSRMLKNNHTFPSSEAPWNLVFRKVEGLWKQWSFNQPHSFTGTIQTTACSPDYSGLGTEQETEVYTGEAGFGRVELEVQLKTYREGWRWKEGLVHSRTQQRQGSTPLTELIFQLGK